MAMKRGYYSDPQAADRLRWWDGKQWTASTARPGGVPITPKSPTWYRAWVSLAILILVLLVAATAITQAFGT